MNLNPYMHPDNIYKNRPDFRLLAVKYPEFREHVTQDLSGKVSVDFKNPSTLRALTHSLLKEDFGLDVFIPPNRLIPTLPQRLNYLLWVNDLLAMDSFQPQDVWGVDVGTGATCIFPLLGHIKFGWKFIATDCDPDAVAHAQNNVNRNSMESKIEVMSVLESNTDVLCEVLRAHEDKTFGFCVCNPPFFSSEEEANSTAKAFEQQRSPPKAANDASSCEAVTEGGEVAFVKKIIADSLILRERIRIYTVMLGKKSSHTALLQELKKNKVENVSTTELCQGCTMRWGLAWSFVKSIKLAEAFTVKRKKKKGRPAEIFIPSYSEEDPEGHFASIRKKILDHLRSFKIEAEQLNSTQVFQYSLKARNNTWIHQRRQRREALRMQGKLETKQIVERKRPLEDCETSKIPPSKLICVEDSANNSAVCSQNVDEVPQSKQIVALNQDDNVVPQENSSVKTQALHLDVGDNSVVLNDNYALFCHMSMQRLLTGVTVQLTWTGGHLGLNGFQQMVQFLRNAYATMFS